MSTLTPSSQSSSEPEKNIIHYENRFTDSLKSGLDNTREEIFRKQIDVQSDFKNETYDAIALSSLAYHFLKNASDFERAIAELQYQTIQTKHLVLNKTKEYLFLFEVFPSPEDLEKPIPDKIINSFAKVHNNQNIVGKSTILGQKSIDEINSKVKLKINLPLLVSDMWRSIHFNLNPKAVDCLNIPNYIFFEYDWFDPISYDIIKKRSVIFPFERDGRYFILGSGFTISKTEKKITLDIYYKTSVVLFPIIVFILYYFILKNKLNNIGLVCYFIVSIICYKLIYANLTEPGTYEKELSDKKDQATIALGIAGIALGLSIASNQMTFNNRDNKELFIKVLMIAFMIFIFTLLVNTSQKIGEKINKILRIRSFLMFVGVLLISSTVIMYTFESR